MTTITQTDSPVTLVAPNIYQVRVPLPFRLNHVNCYLLHDNLSEGAGWTIVDTGLNWPDAKETWKVALAELSIEADDIHQLVLTHMHPDHFGLAGWFQEWCGKPLYLSPLEAEMAEKIWVHHAWRPEAVMEWWDACGVPRDVSKDAAEQTTLLRERTLPHPTDVRTIDYGATARMGGRDFLAIHAPGHADGQIIFYNAAEKLMLSGDQVLMRITPNIGLWPTTEAGPLNRYLVSLRQLAKLDVQVALPGHRNVIEDWAGRIGEILAHHDERLQYMKEAVGKNASAYDVSERVFPLDKLSPHEVRFAVAETLAHLEYLVENGELEREGEQVWTYRLV